MKRKGIIFIPSIFILFLTSCAVDTFFVNPESETKNSLYIANKPNVTDYNVGEYFSLDGIKVIDGTSGETITSYTSSINEGYQFVNSDIGTDKEVYISKKGYKQASFKISVSDLPHLEIKSYPKQEFIVGEYFSLDGLVITYNGIEITDYTCNFKVGNRLNTSGSFTVTISKSGYWSVSYDINVYPTRSLFINKLPNKTNYVVGESFTSEGLIIYDERDNVINDYQLSINEGTILKYSGSTTVEVKKEGYRSATFEINVEEASSTDVINRDLTIYYINDTHGSFIRNASEDEGGMSYISTYLKNKVNANPNNSIVLSGGDMFQGGYESNETRGAIMIDTMNEIGFDAMVLGNHEFDWGEEYIKKFDESLDCPIISANTFYSYDNVTRPSWLTPYTVISRGDLKIGIIGGAKKGLGSSITGNISDNFYFPEPNQYIKQYSTYLRQSEGCDVIIAAFHDGGFEGYSGSPTIYQDLTETDPSTNRKYVDAMFFAHDHLRKQGTYNDVPYLEAACNGKNIGELTLSLTGNGVSYSVNSSHTNMVYTVSECKVSDPAIDALLTKEEYVDIISHADDLIYTFKNYYSEEDFTSVVCMAMHWFVNNNKDKFDNTTVYFASHNTGGVRDDVSIGAFTMRDLVKVFPFDNQLSIQTCTAKNINNLSSSSYYRTYQDGEIVYDSNGHTKAVSITYITEYKYANNYQVDYKNYDYTAKDALVAYLKSGVNTSL